MGIQNSDLLEDACMQIWLCAQTDLHACVSRNSNMEDCFLAPGHYLWSTSVKMEYYPGYWTFRCILVTCFQCM